MNISLEEAQQQTLRNTRPLSTETLPIMASLKRVCSADVTAPGDLPREAQSAVYGYALPSLADQYLVTGAITLGQVSRETLKPGEALAVATGGILPDGTISVIPHEKTAIKNETLYPLKGVKPGDNIKRPGEDYTRGSILISKGSVISAAHISLLAAFGIRGIEVYRQPKTAILCLSKNIVSWQAEPEPGQMRDSNGPLLSMLIMQDGGIPTVTPAAGLSDTSLLAAAGELLEQADMLIITGGTYAEGDHKAHSLIKELGAELIYRDASVKPGSHIGASLWNSRLLFALSGNPAACAVGYHLFAAPALRFMQGLSPDLKRITATCVNGYPKKTASRNFLRGRLSWSADGFQVTVLPGQKPSMISSLVDCNALIDMPAGSQSIEAGQEVSVILF